MSALISNYCSDPELQFWTTVIGGMVACAYQKLHLAAPGARDGLPEGAFGALEKGRWFNFRKRGDRQRSRGR